MAEQDEQSLILGRFRVEGVISQGSFGVVVRAFDTRLKRVVAIKRLNVADSPDPETARILAHRFKREAQAFGRVRSHPNIVTVYDFAQDSVTGISYLILEYVSGETLSTRIGQGPLPIDLAVRLCQDYARGLHAAHEADIVHRDVKPANLFIAADGRGQVGDFGVAQIDDGLSRRTYLTREHPGTPRYMSPEQEQSTVYLRPQSDQYSLGLVLFEMLTGLSFKRVGPREVERRLAELPPSVAALVRRMTMPNPDDRFPTLEDVVRAIGAMKWNLGAQGAAAGNGYAERRGGSGPLRPLAAPAGGEGAGGGARSLLPVAAAAEAAAPAPDATAVAAGPRPTPASGYPSVAAPADVPPRRRSLVPVAALIALLLIALTGTLAASGAFGLRDRAAGVPTVAVGLAPEATPTVAIAAAPPFAAAAVAPASVPIAPTATVAPPATPTPPPTAARASVPTPVPATPPASGFPAAVPPPIYIYGFGTIAQAGLDPVAPDDVVEEFAAGQPVFVYINFEGARPGVDYFELVITTNNIAQPPRPIVIHKPSGFMTEGLGALPLGDYRIELRRNGAAIFAAKTFRVIIAPTPTPRPAIVPTPTPASAPVPVAPTPTPRPAAPTPTPAPPAPPAPPPPTTAPPKPSSPTPVPGSG